MPSQTPTTTEPTAEHGVFHVTVILETRYHIVDFLTEEDMISVDIGETDENGCQTAYMDGWDIIRRFLKAASPHLLSVKAEAHFG